jgi:hypothetical protein
MLQAGSACSLCVNCVRGSMEHAEVEHKECKYK